MVKSQETFLCFKSEILKTILLYQIYLLYNFIYFRFASDFIKCPLFISHLTWYAKDSFLFCAPLLNKSVSQLFIAQIEDSQLTIK